jgi:hypothetical protein
MEAAKRDSGAAPNPSLAGRPAGRGANGAQTTINLIPGDGTVHRFCAPAGELAGPLGVDLYMPRSVMLAALLAVGCAQSSPQVRPRPATAVAIDVVGRLDSAVSTPSRGAPYTRVAHALKRYRAALHSKDRPSEVDENLERLREVRRELFDEIGERTLVSVVEHRCSSGGEACWQTSHSIKGPISFAVLLLRDFGEVPTLRLLTRFESWGIRPPVVREQVYRRLMEESMTETQCVPPSLREVDRARKDLADFVVVDEVRGHLVPREPTEAERDDLAYFMAAVSSGAPRPEQFVAGRRKFQRCSVPPSRHRFERIRLREQALRAAEVGGQLEEVARARQDYLDALGYPDPVNSCRGIDRGLASRYEQAKTCLAGDLEALGRTHEAEQLYRRIRWWRPYCAAGSRRTHDSQARALIRTAERSGGCRRVVAERLRALEGEAYGPLRLARAGFDLPRLYRGALLTRNRHGDAGHWIRSLNAARPELAARAIARLQRRGLEAWERQVLALEGLADSAQRDALEPLETVLPVLDEAGKLRALHALSTLAWRGRAETVACTQVRWNGSNGGSRPINTLGHSCATRLGESEARALSRGLAPFLGDSSEHVRVASAQALGSIASKWSRRVLRQVARKRAQPRTVHCSSSGCSTDEALRTAATEALVQIDRAYRAGAEELAEEEAAE